jgi:hypothetical protein
MFHQAAPHRLHMRTRQRSRVLAVRTDLASGLRGFRLVLDGHLGHARFADRTLYRLHRSSPTWLAQNDPEIRALMKHPG